MYALAVHGGAGDLPATDLTPQRSAALAAGLAAALQAGEHILQADGSALDAVQAAVTVLEDDELFNAARGAVLTSAATAELDASLMEGTSLRAGAVALVRRTKNPIRLARYLLEHSPHVFIAGEAADGLAALAGSERVDNDYFITRHRLEQLRAFRQRREAAGTSGTGPSGRGPSGTTHGGDADGDTGGDTDMLGTVGAVAHDRRGRLAAATSTGGTTGKLPGRIGDSPVIGAGTYADDDSCAVSMTGQGEWFLRTVQAYDIAARLRYGAVPLAHAVDAAFERLTQRNARGGLIAVDAGGLIVMQYNSPGLLRAAVREGGERSVSVG